MTSPGWSLLQAVSKHGGPGRHHSGSPQSVHGGDSPAPRRLFPPSDVGTPAPHVGQSWRDLVISRNESRATAQNLAAVDDILQRHVGSLQPFTRVQPDVLAQVLSDGRIRTQHETGRSNGMYDPAARAIKEQALHGTNVAVGDPGTVYGYLSSNPSGGVEEYHDSEVGQYGTVVVRLKPSVHPKTTFTFGDSLDNTGIMVIGNLGMMDPDGTITDQTNAANIVSMAPVPLEAPDHTALPSRYIADGRIEEMVSEEAKGHFGIESLANGGYVEAQYHGGVWVDDIAEVIFHDQDVSYRARESMEMLQARGIPYRVIRPGDPDDQYAYDEDADDWGDNPDWVEVEEVESWHPADMTSYPVFKYSPTQPRDDRGRWARADRIYGTGRLDALFPDMALSTSVPWPQTGRMKTGRPYERDRVIELLDDAGKSNELVDFDPRTLSAMQGSVTLAGVRHYLAENFDNSDGSLYSRTPSRLNRHATVYVRDDGVNIILAGHHRAAAALIDGRSLRARVVRGRSDFGRPLQAVKKHGDKGKPGYSLLHPNSTSTPPSLSQDDQREFDRTDWSPTMTRDQAEDWARDSVVKQPVTFVGRKLSLAMIRRDGFSLDRTSAGRAWGDGVYGGLGNIDLEESSWNKFFAGEEWGEDRFVDPSVHMYAEMKQHGSLTFDTTVWRQVMEDWEETWNSIADDQDEDAARLWEVDNPKPLQADYTPTGPEVAVALLKVNVRKPLTVDVGYYGDESYGAVERALDLSHPDWRAAWEKYTWDELAAGRPNPRVPYSDPGRIPSNHYAPFLTSLGYDSIIVRQFDQTDLTRDKEGFDSGTGGPQIVVFNPKDVTVLVEDGDNNLDRMVGYRYDHTVIKQQQPGHSLLAKHGNGTHDERSHGRRGSAAALTRRGRLGGFTFHPSSRTYPKRGFSVAVPGLGQIFDPPTLFTPATLQAFIDRHADLFAANPALHLGGWYDREHDEMVLDVVEVFDNKSEAIYAGQQRDEQAIFDLENLEEIPTGGSGGRDGQEGQAVNKAGAGRSRRRWGAGELGVDDGGGKAGVVRAHACRDGQEAGASLLLKHGQKGEPGYSLLHPGVPDDLTPDSSPVEIMQAAARAAGLTFQYEKGGSGMVGGTLYADGKPIGETKRIFGRLKEDRFDKADPTVTHESLRLYYGHHGKGYGMRFVAASIEIYRRLGYKQVKVQAGEESGGIVWAKAGFEFAVGPHRFPNHPAKRLQIAINDGEQWAIDFDRQGYGTGGNGPIDYYNAGGKVRELLVGSNWEGVLYLDDVKKSSNLTGYQRWLAYVAKYQHTDDPEAEEFMPSVVSKHGDKGTPGYTLLHPRSRTTEIIAAQVTDKKRANAAEWMAERHLSADALYANTAAILDRASPASLAYGQKWYAEAHKVAIDLHTRYPGTTVEQAAGILAALSPRNKWRYPDDPAYLRSGNVADAYRAVAAIHEPLDIEVTRSTAARAKKMYGCDVDDLIGQWINSDTLTPLQRAAIDPRYKGMPDNVKKAARIAHGETPDSVLGGPKVRSFYNNILDVDDSDSATIDSHQVRAMIGRIDLPDKVYEEIAGNAARYEFFADVVRRLAHDRSIPPHVVQAITWEQWRLEHPESVREAENPSNIASARDVMIGDILYPAPTKAKTPRRRGQEGED